MVYMRITKYSNFARRVSVVVPVSVFALVAGYSTAAMMLLLSGNATTGLLFGLGGFMAVLYCYIANRLLSRSGVTEHLLPAKGNEFLVVGLLFIVILGAWIGINAHYSFTTAFIDRDPGIYATTAAWLVEHPSTNIPYDTDITDQVSELRADSSGVWYSVSGDKSFVQPQGEHLFAVLLSTAGRIFGVAAIYKTNVIIGALAVVVFYGFMLLFVRPRYALLGATILMASLPFIYFSRDTYTEPTALLLSMGALLIGYLGVSAWQRRSSSEKISIDELGLWLFVGLSAGLPPLVRPDGYVITASILAVSLLVIVTARLSKGKRMLVAAMPILGSALGMGLAYLDVITLTSSYFLSHGKDIIRQLALIGFLVVGAVGVVAIVPAAKIKTIFAYAAKKSRVLFLVATAIVLLTGLFMASRPLIMQPSGGSTGPAVGFVNNLQSRLGDVVEPRTYAEYTVSWLSWYLGGILVVLFVVGLIHVLHGTIVGKRVLFLFILVPAAVTIPVYLYNPHITPDQIWAMRRFVPVVFPITVLLGMMGLSFVVSRVKKHARDNSSLFAMGAVTIAAMLVVQPLLVTRPFARTQEAKNQLTVIRSLCDMVPKDAVVVWLETSTLAQNATQSTRAFCGIESLSLNVAIKSEGYVRQQTLRNIAQVAKAENREAFLAMPGSIKQFFTDRDQIKDLRLVGVYGGELIERTLMSPPDNVINMYDSVEYARIATDGRLVSP